MGSLRAFEPARLAAERFQVVQLFLIGRVAGVETPHVGAVDEPHPLGRPRGRKRLQENPKVAGYVAGDLARSLVRR